MGEKKLGLVLSGGGARGAYEAGVVRYMAEIGMEPDMYAGASIGALNGAVLVSSGNLKHGARKLRTVWREIAMDTVVKVNPAMLGGLAVVAAARAILGPLPVWSTAKPALMKALSTTAEIEAFWKHMDADPFSQMLAKGLGAEELDAAQAANGGLLIIRCWWSCWHARSAPTRCNKASRFGYRWFPAPIPSGTWWRPFWVGWE